jgi:Kelch motif/Secretion system C-terminal sorting domain
MKKLYSAFSLTVIVVLSCLTGASAQWSSLTMQGARSGLAAAAGGDKVIFAGGIGMINIPPAASDIYTVSTGNLIPGTISQGRYHLAGAAAGSKLFFGGGEDGWILSIRDRVDIYDGASGSWATAALSVPRSKLAAASAGKVVAFGGGIDTYQLQNVLKTVDIVDTASMLAAAGAGNKIVFAGGGNYLDRALRTVDIYTVGAGSWSTAALSVARMHCTGVASGNKIYIAGGVDSLGNASNVIDIYDVVLNTWTTDTLSSPRSQVSSGAYGDLVFFAGGKNGTSVSNVVDIFNTTTQTWTQSTLTTARYGAAAAAISNKFLIGGGLNASTMPVNTIEIYSFVTAIEDAEVSSSALSVFPSPLAENTDLNLINTLSLGSIEILDETGRIVYSVVLNENNTAITVPSSTFSSGVYHVRLSDGKRVVTKKFIKL